MNSKYIRSIKSCLMLVTLMTLSILSANAQSANIQKEIINGKPYIIHKLQSKETYYQLSRIYGIPVTEIQRANKNKSLKVGDTVKIPSNEPVTEVISSTTAIQKQNERKPENKIIEYKVSTGETLFAIAKRFRVSVQDLKTLNNLSSDNLKNGQILKVGFSESSESTQSNPIVEQEEPVILPSSRSPNVSETDFKSNAYGIREKSEKGVGVWMKSLETRSNSNLALHRTAPVGTILKIINPVTKTVTYAKVVGKFADNSETSDAIVVLSKSAAATIGAKDRRFAVEITYGTPLNQNK